MTQPARNALAGTQAPGASLTDATSRRSAYRVPRHPAPVELALDGNEAPATLLDPLDLVGALDVATLNRYPDPTRLARAIAARHGLDPARVLVTAGVDDGLLRACQVLGGAGRQMIVPVPTFEMLERYAVQSGADMVRLPWEGGAYPVAAVLEASGSRTSAVAVVSPNNPTGAVATLDDLQRLSGALPDATILLDHAYVEFADEDLTQAALQLPNVVVFRTLSKAFGLAGLRVGWLAGPGGLVEALRSAGGPYPVSAPSLALAERWLATSADAVGGLVARVRDERRLLTETLGAQGLEVRGASQGNFVLARTPRALWFRDALAGQGIGVRAFPDRAGLEDAVRITCPGSDAGLARLRRALATARDPQALLFDMDGVLVDVSESYDAAIRETAGSFGVTLTADDIRKERLAGAANDDWALTRRLLAARGVDAALDEVTRRFEAVYQGDAGSPGTREVERPLVERAWLVRLAARWPLAIVTGRPRADAERFLERFGLTDVFSAVICREDAPALKPDPAPVRAALASLASLGVERAWMLGDTPDDVRAARAAGVLPLGCLAPGDGDETARRLLETGAARVLSAADELEDLLS